MVLGRTRSEYGVRHAFMVLVLLTFSSSKYTVKVVIKFNQLYTKLAMWTHLIIHHRPTAGCCTVDHHEAYSTFFTNSLENTFNCYSCLVMNVTTCYAKLRIIFQCRHSKFWKSFGVASLIITVLLAKSTHHFSVASTIKNVPVRISEEENNIRQ